MQATPDAAKRDAVREKILRLSPAELDAVDRLLEVLEIKRLRQSLGEAVDAACAAGLPKRASTYEGTAEEFGGFKPFPSRGGIVTDELINQLRKGDIY